ncbi:hypothetical protein PCANC_06931 [Puccinia coronata f. sp. avenae]|uniref:Uncharacterized protein n=1 Tax=Puccinia coronata f. sp. avenae TaxID=200324 RepID=A0A2N5VKP2_9BASI|nr:hypothetical protein PCANC_06931 [Puccinia coronata f. sp. avenae]
MIALADRSPPVITYTDTSVIRVLDAPSAPPDMINKTNVIGLGHVTHRGEVISNEPERSLCLEHALEPSPQALHSKICCARNQEPCENPYSVSSHETARGLAASGSGGTPSPRTARNFNKAEGGPSSGLTPKGPAKPFKTAFTKVVKASASRKGKAKAVEPESEAESSSVDYMDDAQESPLEPITPPAAKRGRPRKEDLVAAAKKMRRQ